MAEKNGTIDGAKRALAIAVASAFVGGAGGPLLLVKLGAAETLRPDPFTGAQAAVLESRVEALENHVAYHPDITNQFDRRITTLEVQYANILANQERIIQRLDKR